VTEEGGKKGGKPKPARGIFIKIYFSGKGPDGDESETGKWCSQTEGWKRRKIKQEWSTGNGGREYGPDACGGGKAIKNCIECQKALQTSHE